MKMKIVSGFMTVAVFATIIISCNNKEPETMDIKLKELVKQIEAKIIPLNKAVNIAYFNASISGKDEDYKKSEDLQIQLTKVFADTSVFAQLKKIKESNAVTNDTLKRVLLVYYNRFLENQLDTSMLNAMTRQQIEIEKKYSNYRAEVKGKKLTDNQIEDVLSNSTKSDELKDTWMAHKKIGSVVAADILKLVKMRNEAAKKCGFSNFHEMRLKLSEQDPQEIEKIFDELDNLTRESFASLKNDIDEYFVKRYNVKKENLMPWHYQDRFFQEAPKIFSVDFDTYYKGKDLVALTQKYYSGLGVPVDDIMKNSDLFEKPGKNQHAYCIDMDNEGDVRVLCNVKENAKWMNTMLHEFGHAVYDKNIGTILPYVLREPAHTFTTEAVAMFFGRMATNPAWMKENLGISDDEVTKIADNGFKSLRLEQLTFSRWAQVMYRFEKSMYANPDQDLNKLWWDLVEKYQMLKRPTDRNEPDWASKIHIATSPCYYHNYLLGELLASQMYYHICDKIVKTTDYKNQGFTNNKEVGKFFVEKIFKPALMFNWNDMIEKATGEKLSAKYYAKQFVN